MTISEGDLHRAKKPERLFELDRRGPPRNGPAHMLPFLFAMDRGDLAMQIVHIPISCSQRALSRRLVPRMRESHDHMMLKASALWWMRDCGAADAEEECDTGYYRYDIGSDSFPWLVECGNVSADALRLAIPDTVRPRPYRPSPTECSEHILICGGALGADRLAEEWADVWGVRKRIFAADWQRHGKAAGPIRNQQMIDEGKPELVIAFPGGRGTADMVRRAEAAGIKVIQAGRVSQ